MEDRSDTSANLQLLKMTEKKQKLGKEEEGLVCRFQREHGDADTMISDNKPLFKAPPVCGTL
jgi:hypothetical protein